MDLSDPTRAVTSTLDGTVLAVLAVAGSPLTVGQVAERAARGSEIGIRRSIERLIEQGTICATTMGRNRVHELNHDHLAAQVAMALGGMRLELWRRMRDEIDSWRPRPLYAAVFGSAARGDGDAASDIDLLLVHPPFPGDKRPRMSASLREQLSDALGSAVLASADKGDAKTWESNLVRFHGLVERWTGNPLQIVDMTFWEWRQPPPEHQSLLRNVAAENIELRKARGLSVWAPRSSTDE